MSDYYTASNDPPDNSDAEPGVLRAEHQAMAFGFTKVAGYTGNGGKIVAINAGGTAQEAVPATGTGDVVRATSPALVAPALGTPQSGNLQNCTGLPVGSITGFATGIATWLANSSVANLLAALTGGVLAALGTVQSWTKAQRGTPVALTSSAGSIAVDLDLANNFTHTLTENTTLAAPSNPVAGQSGSIVITQHASAAKTLAYNAFWKFPGGIVPTVSTGASAVDVLSYYVESGTRATCVLLRDVK